MCKCRNQEEITITIVRHAKVNFSISLCYWCYSNITNKEMFFNDLLECQRQDEIDLLLNQVGAK